MKNTHQWQWAVTLCSTVVLCGTLAAQTPSPSNPPQSGQPTSSPQSGQPTSSSPEPSSTSPQSSQPAGRSSNDMAGQVTATGCLQRDSSSSSDTSSSASGAGGGFVLKNAKMGGSGSSMGSSSAPGSAGASASDPSGRAPGSMSGSRGAKDVNLVADSSVNLAEHVGHQVMITGRMAGSGPVDPSSSSTPSSSDHSTAGKGGAFTVAKISMISATCTAGS